MSSLLCFTVIDPVNLDTLVAFVKNLNGVQQFSSQRKANSGVSAPIDMFVEFSSTELLQTARDQLSKSEDIVKFIKGITIKTNEQATGMKLRPRNNGQRQGPRGGGVRSHDSRVPRQHNDAPAVGNRQRHQDRPRDGQSARSRRTPFTPYLRTFVAVLDNVPVDVTNEELATLFTRGKDGSGETVCDSVVDINRYENMAMVYLDDAKSVKRAISQLNGVILDRKLINTVMHRSTDAGKLENVQFSFYSADNNTIPLVVSHGGVVKVPLPPAPAPAIEIPTDAPSATSKPAIVYDVSEHRIVQNVPVAVLKKNTAEFPSLETTKHDSTTASAPVLGGSYLDVLKSKKAKEEVKA